MEKFKADIPSHAPTPPEVFFSRRKFMTTVAQGILLSPAIFLAAGAKDRHAGLLDEPYVGTLYPDEPRTPQIPLHAGQVAR